MSKEIKVLNLYALKGSEVEELLDRSMDGEEMGMDERTFCLYDLKPYKIPDYQSLIIQKDGQMYKSRQTTNKLLQDFSRSLYSVHDLTNVVASKLEIYKKVPYVIGERGIIPLDGYTKKPVTWVVSNHAIRATYDTKRNIVHLKTEENLVLKIESSKKGFQEQLERTARILRYKITLNKGRVKQYKYFYKEPNLYPRNILWDHYDQLICEGRPITYFEVDEEVRLHVQQQQIKKLFGEGNPYYDDFLNLT